MKSKTWLIGLALPALASANTMQCTASNFHAEGMFDVTAQWQSPQDDVLVDTCVVKGALNAYTGTDERTYAIGFELRLKPFIQRADGSAKGDWDVGITLDAMDYADQVDTVVLASGDGDFALLAERIQQKYGCRVEVYGVPKLTAAALINAATQFIPVEGELLL